jgi:Replication-relaxation
MSASRLGRRGLEDLQSELSGRDLAIVAQVADLRLMSARHIEAIHFTLADHASAITAARSARRVLERLVRDRLLVRLTRRVGGVRAGSASFVYAIGPVGQRLIGKVEPRVRFREPSDTFALHTLAITQFIVELTLGSRAKRFELLGLQPEPTCWRTSSAAMGVGATLRPDLFVSIGLGEYEYRWFVEIDLGTEHLPTLLRKCAAYETYYRTGTEQHRHGVFPRVLWIMDGPERVQRLRTAIDRDGQLTSALFTVTTEATAMDIVAGGAS